MEYMKKVEKNMKKLETKGKTLFLAQDQGLEHGAFELTGESMNPNHVFKIAEKGEVDGFICHKGIAEKYSSSYNVNLVLKVNGKCLLGDSKADPYSPVVCSVRRAVDIGAKAIGFTNFPGSIHQSKIFEDFQKIQEEAHDFGLPVTSWMYPRGKFIKNDLDRETLAYSARIGQELGADMLKMRFNGNIQDMEYQIRSGGKAKMLMAGGPKTKTSKEFLSQIKKVNDCGIGGFAIGRNIWLHKDPISMTKAIRDIQIRGKSITESLNRLK